MQAATVTNSTATASNPDFEFEAELLDLLADVAPAHGDRLLKAIEGEMSRLLAEITQN